jgi:S1-C subfamily serine protease
MQGLDRMNFDDMFKGFEGLGDFNSPFEMQNMNKKPKIGISATDVGDDKGIKIDDVKKDSYADKAGLKVGDVIIEIANEPVFNTTDLKKATKKFNEGDSPVFKINRNGKTQEIKVNIAKAIKSIEF